jgi:hypothetical protein
MLAEMRVGLISSSQRALLFYYTVLAEIVDNGLSAANAEQQRTCFSSVLYPSIVHNLVLSNVENFNANTHLR